MGGSQQVPKDIVQAQIHPSVKKIEPNAFSDCKELRYVEFSDGLEVIGHRAFYRCAKLTLIRLSSTTKEIEMEAFRSCKKLKHVLFNEGLEELGTSAFAECKAIQYLSFSSMMQLVGQNAFLGCTALQKVAFNFGLEKVESGAFSNCRKLKLVVMPSEVPSLLSDAIPDEAIIEDTRNEKFWTKVLRTAEDVEANLVKQYCTVAPSEEDQPENDISEPAHASELEEARMEIEMLKGLLKDMKSEAKKSHEDFEVASKDCDKLRKDIKTGRAQLEDALTLAEELQEELTFVDEQRQATQELLEKALDQRDELAKAKNNAELDRPNMVDFKEFEEHVDFIEAQAEETRKEFEKTAKECSSLQKENSSLRKKNKQLEQIMHMRNKEYMDLLAQHVDAQLQIMGAAPEQVMAVVKAPAKPQVKSQVKSPDTPSKKKKTVNATKSPGKSPETPSKKKKTVKKKKTSSPSRASTASTEPSDDALHSKKAVVAIPMPDIVPMPSEPVEELTDDAFSESEFGSERDILEESKIEVEPLAVDVVSEKVKQKDEWEDSLDTSNHSHKRIDWVGQIHEVTVSVTKDETCEDVLLGQFRSINKIY